MMTDFNRSCTFSEIVKKTLEKHFNDFLEAETKRKDSIQEKENFFNLLFTIASISTERDIKIFLAGVIYSDELSDEKIKELGRLVGWL